MQERERAATRHARASAVIPGGARKRRHHIFILAGRAERTGPLHARSAGITDEVHRHPTKGRVLLDGGAEAERVARAVALRRQSREDAGVGLV